MHNIAMWTPLLLLFLAGTTLADFNHGWKPGNEYRYLVRTRTLTTLEEMSSHQYAGIIVKAIITVQSLTQDTIRSKLTQVEFANIHKYLPDGWESNISDQQLNFKPLEFSNQPFEMKIKHGIIRDLIVDQNVPTWQLNIIKSVISRLQVDTQGENVKRGSSVQAPTDNSPYAMFRAMEDSVAGKCEVLYDISPLPDLLLQNNPELVPLPSLRNGGEFIAITKTKNYDRCEQRMEYKFAIGNTVNNIELARKQEQIRRSSSSFIVISGNLKDYVIQSSVTTDIMFASPQMAEQQNGVVYSKMNLTMVSMNKISQRLPPPSAPESTGNLVYTFNLPFSTSEHRRPSRPSGASPNSQPESDSSSKSASSSGDSGWNDSAEHRRQNKDNNAVSSSSSSSQEATNENMEFWQTKPQLQEPPNIPLLPFFIGNKGKVISSSSEIDPVATVKNLVKDIAQNMEYLNEIPSHGTLEKFTILYRFIRTMNVKQIAQSEGDFLTVANQVHSNNKHQTLLENSKSVFRDAIVQAGTGPALLTIVDWIQKRKIEGYEAAEVISRIPATAITPTSAYVDAFFMLLKKPEVQNQMFLNSSAFLTFGQLVHNAHVSVHRRQNHYPVHSFGILSPKNDKSVIEKYIPYLAEQLTAAIKNGDSTRIQAVVFALGEIAHPNILDVFEPYLEGKERVSTYQRFAMISAMYKVAALNPKLLQPILYKIYLNIWEAHEIRCLAIYLLMRTDPPLVMLQRMAVFTNYDSNKQVNSAVKSSIKYAARLKTPKWQSLAKKARMVEKLLTPIQYSYLFSHSHIFDHIARNKDFAYKLTSNYISNDDSLYPYFWETSLDTSYNGFETPTTKMSFILSSMKNLLRILWREAEPGKKQPTQVEKLAKILGIEPNLEEQVEGGFFFQSKYSNNNYYFDNHTLEKIPQFLERVLPKLEKGQDINWKQLESYDTIVSFPTETGLPFVYSLNVPHIMDLNSYVKSNFKDANNMFVRANVRLFYSKKVQGRIGFITPFDHQHFISGVDKNVQASLPGTIQVKGSQKNFEIKLLAYGNDAKVGLIHYSVIPFTSKHNIFNLIPLLKDKETHQMRENDSPFLFSASYPSIKNDVFTVEVEMDQSKDKKEDFPKKIRNILKQLSHHLVSDHNMYQMFNLHMKLKTRVNDAVVFSFAMDSMQSMSQNNMDSDKTWLSAINVPLPTDRKPDSENRRQQFLKDAIQGMNSAEVHVVDMNLQIPGELQHQHVVTMAFGGSNVQNRFRILFYWHIASLENEIAYEVCANTQNKYWEIPLLDYEKALNSSPKDEFNIDARYGESCSTGKEIHIRGSLEQNQLYKDMLRNSDVTKQCQAGTKKGKKDLLACEQIIDQANNFNQLNAVLSYNSDNINHLVSFVLPIITESSNLIVTANPDEMENADEMANENHEIKINAEISPDYNAISGKLITEDYTMTLPNFQIFTSNDPSLLPLQENKNFMTTSEERYKSYCVIDRNQVKTFDDKVYPLQFGMCSYVAMITIPNEELTDHGRTDYILDDMRFSIITREMSAGKKEFKFLLSNKEVQFRPNGERIEVLVSGLVVSYSRSVSYKEIENDETIFEIYERDDGSVTLTSDKYEIEAIYDGERIRIEVNEKYRKSVRGLCGNFDDHSDNDFVSPKNCLLKKPEEFTATYAVKDQCDAAILEIAKRLEKLNCSKQEIRFSNVISNDVSGKLGHHGKKWGYHNEVSNKRCNTYRTQIIAKENHTCFTTRPVPACKKGCNPVNVKPKIYQLYCEENGPAAEAIKRRIQAGANPDFSQYPVFGTQSISVPMNCVAT